MLKPIQVLLRDEVAPLLKARGFRRSGGTFRALNTDGDAAIISIRSWRLGRNDLEFFVEVGFTTAEHLSSPANVRGVAADRINITDTYSTWERRVRDPSLTPMDHDQLWAFDLGDQVATARFVTVLDMAAEDLVRRMDEWPSERQDSLSDDPIFRTPIEVGTRSAWFKDPNGEWDYRYSRLGQVFKSGGVIENEGRFDVTLLFHEIRVLIQLSHQAAKLLTGGRPLGEFAGYLQLRPTPASDLIPLQPVAPTDQVWVQSAATNAVLVMRRGDGRRPAFISLGELPQSVWRMAVEGGLVQLELLIADANYLTQATRLSKAALARAGLVWGGTVATVSDD